MAEENKESKEEQDKKERKDPKAPAEKAHPEEKKEEAKKPEEEKSAAKEATAPEAQVAEKKEEGPKKKKKINRLTLKEVKMRLQEVQEKMGGLASSYAQQLLKRKEQLLVEKETSNQSTRLPSDQQGGQAETRVQEKQESAESRGDDATNS